MTHARFVPIVLAIAALGALPPALAAPQAPSSVTITLVRWPFT
jgi:hypothetical protein